MSRDAFPYDPQDPREPSANRSVRRSQILPSPSARRSESENRNERSSRTQRHSRARETA